ncbi:MAG: chemotaxis protein CheX [Planctomycetes bacterium]|nr:chemotaxis protein CheX [Planctomycetota bacterium]
MKAEYINPFVTSTVNVFSTMLDCALERDPLCTKASFAPLHEVSGIIGLSGKAAGTVVLSLCREVALQATAALLLGERPTEIDADVIDAVGELANMIAGNAKIHLEELSMSVSLPSVICGKNHSLTFPSQATPIIIPFRSPWGPLSIEVGLVEVLESCSG